MSVIGATDWHAKLVATGQSAALNSPSTESYLTDFLNEAARKIGPAFYTAWHSNLGYLDGVVRIEAGQWILELGAKVSGSALPFTKSGTRMIPVPSRDLSTLPSSAVSSWVIQEDGSVKVDRAAFLDFAEFASSGRSFENMVDLMWVPDLAEGGKGKVKSLRDVQLNLKTGKEEIRDWLKAFSAFDATPTFAVCLQEDTFTDDNNPGVQVGLLLKQVAKQGDTAILVKIGFYNTRSLRVRDVETRSVDWLIW